VKVPKTGGALCDGRKDAGNATDMHQSVTSLTNLQASKKDSYFYTTSQERKNKEGGYVSHPHFEKPLRLALEHSF